MASAVASNVHAGPAAAGAMSFGWLGPPRLSFGARDAAAAVVSAEVEVDEPGSTTAPKAEPAAICKDFIDFEFSLGGSATMLPADELFADGKLLPLRPQAPAAKMAAASTEAALERVRRDTALVAEVSPSPEPVRAIHPAAAEAALDPYVFSPKAPTCSSRWRELLRLRKVQTPQKPSPSASSAASPSASPAAAMASTPSRASSSSAARSLKLLLLQRNGGGRASTSDLSAAPLLRDSSDSEASLSLASSRFSLSSSSSSSAHDHDDFPRHSLDSVDPTPRPRIRLVRSHPHAPPPQPQPHAHPPIAASASTPAPASAPARAAHSPARRRQSPSPPPPPSVVSVDSPRMNASGKIVFQGLERSSSSPAGSVHSSMRSRSRVMDRSYSAGVRATPVVLNVPVCSRPVFGFFKDKKDAAAKDAASARARSALGRRTVAAGSTSSTPAPGAGGVGGRDLGSGN